MNNLIIQPPKEVRSKELDFKKLVDQWIDELDVNQESKRNYRKGVIAFFKWHTGDQYPTRKTILEFKKFLQEKYKSHTTAVYLTHIRLFFTWLNSEYQFPNPASMIKEKKPKSRLKDALSREQVRSLLDFECLSISDYRDQALIMLKVANGLRDISLMTANCGDLSTLSGRNVLHYQKKGSLDKDEFVFLKPETYKALRNYLAIRGKYKSSDPLFMSHGNSVNNERLSLGSLYRITNKRLENVGLASDRVTPHSLRHTCVTLMHIGCNEDNVGDAIRKIQKAVAHANYSTTEGYSHDLERAQDPPELHVRW